jgi:hypothetical protein
MSANQRRARQPHLDEGTLRAIYSGPDRSGHVIQRDGEFAPDRHVRHGDRGRAGGYAQRAAAMTARRTSYRD